MPPPFTVLRFDFKMGVVLRSMQNMWLKSMTLLSRESSPMPWRIPGLIFLISNFWVIGTYFNRRNRNLTVCLLEQFTFIFYDNLSYKLAIFGQFDRDVVIFIKYIIGHFHVISCIFMDKCTLNFWQFLKQISKPPP